MNSNKLKSVMKLKGITYEELSKKLGISKGALQSYIYREKAPSDLLKKICSELEVSSDYLLDLKDYGSTQL